MALLYWLIEEFFFYYRNELERKHQVDINEIIKKYLKSHKLKKEHKGSVI